MAEPPRVKPGQGGTDDPDATLFRPQGGPANGANGPVKTNPANSRVAPTEQTVMLVSPLGPSAVGVGPASREARADGGAPPAGWSQRPPQPHRGTEMQLRRPQSSAPPPQYASQPAHAAPLIRSLPAPPLPIAIKGKPDPRLIVLSEPDSPRAASYRLLRDNLLAKRLPRILAITSAKRGDGKTTCAINLGMALAELATRVLVVDANVFNPALGDIFGIDPTPASAPPQANPFAPYRVAELSRNMHIAALHVPKGEPAPRFDRQWMETKIGALCRVDYDFILIDAPAIDVSPSVTQLTALSDATLVAVRAGETTARVLKKAVDQLPPGKGIGLALIDAYEPSAGS